MTILNPEDSRFDTKQAAEFLGVKPETLEVWRCTKRYSIPYIKIGRLVRYSKISLTRWMDSRTEGGDHDGK